MSVAAVAVRIPCTFYLAVPLSSRPPPPHVPPRCLSALSPARSSTFTSSAQASARARTRYSCPCALTESPPWGSWPSARASSLAWACPRRRASTSCSTTSESSSRQPRPRLTRSCWRSPLSFSRMRKSARARGFSRASYRPRPLPVRRAGRTCFRLHFSSPPPALTLAFLLLFFVQASLLG